jgi:hypothetical protein
MQQASSPPVGTPECDEMMHRTAKYLKQKVAEIGQDMVLLCTDPKVQQILDVYHSFQQMALDVSDGWTMVFCPNFKTGANCELVFF